MDLHRKALQKYKKRKQEKEDHEGHHKKQVLKPGTKFVSRSQDAQEHLDSLRHVDPCLHLELRPPRNGKKTNENRVDGATSIVPDIRLSSPDPSSEDEDDENDSAAMNNNTDDCLLSKLVYPLPKDAFLSHCFRKKAVFIQSNNTNRANDISDNFMDGLNVKHIFSETSSDNVFLWIRDQTKDTKDSMTSSTTDTMENHTTETQAQHKPLKSVEISDPELAHLLHTTSNHASYCRAPPELEQRLVHAMLRDTGLGCGQYDPTGERMNVMGRGEVEVFIGTTGHVTDWHTDFQENFTIQLSGSKKWTLRQGEVKHPLRGMTPHYECSNDVIEAQLKASRLSNPQFQFGKQDLDTNAFGNEAELVMKAGDILYHPAGMWHKVETLEYGVSINVSLMGFNYAKVVCNALEHLLVKKQEWRQVVCSTSSTQTQEQEHDSNINGCEGSQDVVLSQMDALLKDLPNIINDFRQHGGAECIIPPFLRIPPAFEIVDDDIDADESEDDDDQDESSERSMKDQDGIIEEDGESVNDVVFDLNTFVGPSHLNYDRPSETHRLIQNPLARLTKMKDITSFNDDKAKRDDDDEVDKLYVLNVSYAGNEMHESAVRKVFRDDSPSGILNWCCQLEEKHIDSKSDVRDFSDIIDQDPPPNLFFFGYLVWVPSKDDE